MASSVRLANDLTLAQNPDGGWGYLPGKHSRVEPTAWIILGLTSHERGTSLKVRDQALDWLVSVQQPDGSFRSVPDAANSLWMTAPALLALQGAARPQDASAADRAFHSMLTQKSRTAHPQQSGMRSDVEAWGWTTDAFSWIEPTCMSLIALRSYPREKLASTDELDLRINQGEIVVRARRCNDGGWNYGNFGNRDYALSAFPVPTALALIALMRDVGDPLIKQAWVRLEEMRKTEPSLLSLAWGTIAAKLSNKTSDSWENQLLKHLDARPGATNLDRGLALLGLGDRLVGLMQRA
jgi:hypothetical protein